VTLAGFDGVAPVRGDVLDIADASLETLVRQEHLVKPIIVGHSLGGFLALRFAEEHSEQLGGAVAVDGMPVFPALAQMNDGDRLAAADRFAASIRQATPAQFAAKERSALASMVTDPGAAAEVATLAEKSDPAATGEYVDEMLRADLRPSLDKITTPLLEIVPVPAPGDLPQGFPDSMRAMTPDQLSVAWVQFDRGLFPGAATVKFDPIADSRHFAMLDQPAAFEKALDGFIDGGR
jgi:pimeloyl-ACP methyl ester carboxylesterase